MRATIKQMLAADPALDVVDAAGSGPVALAKVQELQPDVVTLDVEMPGMDGIEVLRRLMADMPTPVIMLSAHTQEGAQRTMEALEAGAIDYVAKPTGVAGGGLRDVAATLIEKIHAASRANVQRLWGIAARPAAVAARPKPATPVRPSAPAAFTTYNGPVVAIGISCGGPATLVEMFPSIPADFPPIILTQHMPPGFTRSMAERLDRISNIDVKEAANDDVLRRGLALIAPGDSHLTLAGRPGTLKVRLDQGPPACGHRPSADVMFRSAAKLCGARTIGVIMTGMGNDGAEALGLIKAAGGRTLAQDQATCVVYGMPKVAAELGNAEKVVPLDEIIPTILEFAGALVPA